MDIYSVFTLDFDQQKLPINLKSYKNYDDAKKRFNTLSHTLEKNYDDYSLLTNSDKELVAIFTEKDTENVSAYLTLMKSHVE